jgi:hypothetical protein
VTTYLLGVSLLVALGFKEHEFFERVVSWVEGLHPGEQQFADKLPVRYSMSASSADFATNSVGSILSLHLGQAIGCT